MAKTFKENLDSILDEREVAEFQKLAENDVLFGALKKILLYGVYYNGTLKPGEEANPLENFALNLVSAQGVKSDAEIGQELRGKWQGVNIVEGAFQMLMEYKLPSFAIGKKENPAR